jgi:diguanylate cyclase (GGDEF)-like protein
MPAPPAEPRPGWLRRWLRLPAPAGPDPLGDFAERLAGATTTAEVRTALAEAAHKLGGRRASDDGGSNLAIPLKFGGRSVGSLRLAADPRRWSGRSRRRLEALASLAAAAEIALEATRKLGSASAAEPVRDPATGLPTAAFLEAHLTQALALARRRKEALSLMAVRVEGLDRLRECDGPEFALMALGLAGRAVAGTLRASDLVARLDGDRLAAVLPGASKADAARIGEVVRRAVAEAGVASSVPATLVASVGVASYPDDAETPRALLSACDQALNDRTKASRRASSLRSALDTRGTPR